MATMSSDSGQGPTSGAGNPVRAQMPSLLPFQPQRISTQSCCRDGVMPSNEEKDPEAVHAMQDKKGIFTMTTMSSDSEPGITSGAGNPFPSDSSAAPSNRTASDNARSLDGRRKATSEFSAGAMSDIDRLAHRRYGSGLTDDRDRSLEGFGFFQDFGVISDVLRPGSVTLWSPHESFFGVSPPSDSMVAVKTLRSCSCAAQASAQSMVAVQAPAQGIADDGVAR